MNNLLQIADNSQRTFDPQLLEPLRPLAGVPIKNIQLDGNPSLLVFPQSLSDCPDKIQDSPIFTIQGEDTLVSGNIMGFIGIGNTRLRIYSRFAKEDEQDYFLHYMLQRVFAINLFDLQYNSNRTDIFDFLIYLFPTYLKRAYRQGLYKEYQTHHFNDPHIRGRIDFAQHIRRNIPFNGNIAYQTREYAYNNDLTQLIRHTIEYIRQHPYAGGILLNDADTKDAIKAIEQATPTYNRQERVKIINRNLRPIQHPYYNEYRYLQQLCLQILRHEELKYGTNDSEIYGILFDGAWLWEEYLATILTDYHHPRNKENKGAIYLFDNPKSAPRYPDFYKPDFILDAKYKGYADKRVSEVDRDDLHQLITYMFIERATCGGLVYPYPYLSGAQDFSSESIAQSSLRGYGGIISLFGLHIPQLAPSWSAFQTAMHQSEQYLLSLLSNSH